jgi:hypothetical protein
VCKEVWRVYIDLKSNSQVNLDIQTKDYAIDVSSV